MAHASNGWDFLNFLLSDVALITDRDRIAVPPPEPSNDLHQLANRHETHRIVRKLRGHEMTRYACSAEFLQSVKGTHSPTARLYLTLLTTGLNSWKMEGIQNNVNNYELPQQYGVHALARTIVKEDRHLTHGNTPSASQERLQQRERRPDAPEDLYYPEDAREIAPWESPN